MSATGARLKVLSIYKQIHRTSQSIFHGDAASLAVVRGKINEEFKKHVDVTEPERINELIGVAVEAEETLRTNVIQAKQNERSEHFKLKVTKDTYMEENTIFDPNADIPKRGRRKKCGDSPKS